MTLRIITGVILIAVVVAIVVWAPAWLVAVAAALVAILAMVEFFSLGDRVGLRAFKKWTVVCAAGIYYAQYAAGMAVTRQFGAVTLTRGLSTFAVSVELIFLVFLFGCAGIGLAMRRPLPEVLPAISVSAAALVFVALPFSYVVRIYEDERAGSALVLFTLALIWAGDTLAYFAGKLLGRVPMAPVLSPKKTWEGAIANLVGSLIVALVASRWIEMDVTVLLLIAAVANIAGQMGDLIESAYKRGAVVKDSGTILPGHGGVLDRIDSLILAVPAVWILLDLLHPRF
jgi:phosphatidate cytidylyltransferase